MSQSGGNIISIALMLAGAGVLIAWLDFIQRNIPDALDAKKRPPSGSLGERAASDEGLDTHHSGTLSSTFPLEPPIPTTRATILYRNNLA